MEGDKQTLPPGDENQLVGMPSEVFQQPSFVDSSFHHSPVLDANSFECEDGSRNAVSDSNRTKAVIANRRSNFFSDFISSSGSPDSYESSIKFYPSLNIPMVDAASQSTSSNSLSSVGMNIPFVTMSIPSTDLSISSHNIVSANMNVTLGETRCSSWDTNACVACNNDSSIPIKLTLPSDGSISSTISPNNSDFEISTKHVTVITANSAVVNYDLNSMSMNMPKISETLEKPSSGNAYDVLHFRNLPFESDGISVNDCISTNIMESHQTLPPAECLQVPIQVIEPICIEADTLPSNTIHLEPSPERVWGPQVSLLTFSCLDVSGTGVVGHIRQVNSTGCLESLGAGSHQGSCSEGPKLRPSNGISYKELCSSVPSVSELEKSSKTEKSSGDGNKLSSVIPKSFTEFDWGRVVLDASFRSKKIGMGWGLGWHSPSTHHKRILAEREPVFGLKLKEMWKGKVARTFRCYGSATALSSDVPVGTKGTFDIPIELCVRSTENENLPLIVEVCTRAIEERGLQNQGIYRVPGNGGSVRQMVEDLNEDPNGLCEGSEKWRDVNVVSSLIKMFFRRLPNPLITNDLYQPAIAASRTPDSDLRLLRLRDVIRDLPGVNFQTFHFLAQHLKRVADNEQINKMDAHNLAIIFGPTLIRPQDNVVTMVADMNDQCRVIESIIHHGDWLFNDDLDHDIDVPKHEDSKESTPVSSISEELLAKAQELGAAGSSSPLTCSRAACQKNRIEVDQDVDQHDSSQSADGHELPKVIEKGQESNVFREVVFEIKRYPAYHFSDSSTFCTENAKPQVRRTHSNESLGQQRAPVATFSNLPSQVTTKSPKIPFKIFHRMTYE